MHFYIIDIYGFTRFYEVLLAEDGFTNNNNNLEKFVECGVFAIAFLY